MIAYEDNLLPFRVHYHHHHHYYHYHNYGLCDLHIFDSNDFVQHVCSTAKNHSLQYLLRSTTLLLFVFCKEKNTWK